MFEIKRLADGWAVYKDNVFVWWCHSEAWANVRLVQLKETL